MEPLEKVCITRHTKDRVFINVVSWVLINVFLAKKYFVWGGEERQGSAEVQEAIAKALIHNQLLTEDLASGAAEVDDVLATNDPSKSAKHPLGKKINVGTVFNFVLSTFLLHVESRIWLNLEASFIFLFYNHYILYLPKIWPK